MAKSMKTFRLSNLIGGINSVNEDNALISFDYQNQGVGSEARDIENFTPFNRGGQKKANGFTLLKAVGANPITGLYRFIRSSGTSYFIVSSGQKLQYLSGGVLTDIYTSLANNVYTHFSTALDSLVFCDSTNDPKTWDGTTVANLTAGADATAINGASQTLFFQNRLFAVKPRSSLIYYSNSGVINAGYSSNFINCDTNDGQNITAIDTFFIPGSLKPVIIVGKDRSVGIVTGSGTASDPYTFAKINRDAGIPGPRCIVQFGQDAAYLTTKGVSTYQTDNQNVNLIYTYMSDKVRDKFNALDKTNIQNAVAFYDWPNRRIGFAVPEASQVYNNVIWFFDTQLECWYKERWAFGQNGTAFMVDTDGTLYHGDSSGNVYTHSSSYNSFNGSAINAYYITPYLDFGAPNLYKRIIAARMVCRGQGAYNLGVSASLDYGARTGGSNNVSLTSSSYTWNGGIWTSNPAVYQWGGSPIAIRKFFPVGFFRSIQFTFSQPQANQPVDLFEIEFDVEFSSLL